MRVEEFAFSFTWIGIEFIGLVQYQSFEELTFDSDEDDNVDDIDVENIEQIFVQLFRKTNNKWYHIDSRIITEDTAEIGWLNNNRKSFVDYYFQLIYNQQLSLSTKLFEYEEALKMISNHD